MEMKAMYQSLSSSTIINSQYRYETNGTLLNDMGLSSTHHHETILMDVIIHKYGTSCENGSLLYLIHIYFFSKCDALFMKD